MQQYWADIIKCIQGNNGHLLGHGTFVSHFCVYEANPTHNLPPWAGAGLVQVLALDWLPIPHVTEHFPQSLNLLHAPLTNIESDDYTVIPVRSFPM